MAFFGLTTHGPTDPVKQGLAPTYDYAFKDFEMDTYLEIFRRHRIGKTNIALTLQIDGDEHILRSALGDMLHDLLGRKPRRFELDAWFTHLDFDRSGIMPVDEYTRAVSNLIEFSANPPKTGEHSSTTRYKTDLIKHTRAESDLQKTQSRPMTTQQEVGWHTLKPGPPQESFPAGTTDVTQKEGRDPKSYYGQFCYM